MGAICVILIWIISMNKKKTFIEKISRYVVVLCCMTLFSLCASGCEEDGLKSLTGDDSSSEAPAQKSDDEKYDDYIHDALEAVKDNAQPTDNTSAAPQIPQTTTDNSGEGQVIYVEKEDSSNVPDEVFVSSQEFDDFDEDEEEPTPTPEVKEPAPDVFDVGRGLVYIDGKYDTSYSANLLKYINDARTGLNYPAFKENSSLGTCANLRSKEITCFLSHFRPDGTKFFSLAPDYYKAEIITIDGADVKSTFDAWLTDPVSRGIIFSEDYGSIGVANYICNGLNCIVVSLGY